VVARWERDNRGTCDNVSLEAHVGRNRFGNLLLVKPVTS